MGARTSRKAVVPRDDASDFEDDTVAGRATQFVGGIRRVGEAKEIDVTEAELGAVTQFIGGVDPRLTRRSRFRTTDPADEALFDDRTAEREGETVQFIGGVRPRLIATIDGVDFVDVTRRGRNTQLIGGVRPRKPAKPRRPRTR